MANMREASGASEAEQTRRPESDPAPPHASIQVQFAVERGDIVKQMEYLAPRSTAARRMRRSLLVVIIGGALLGWLLFGIGRSEINWLGFWLFCGVSGWLAVTLFEGWRNMPKTMADSVIDSTGPERALGPTTMTIDEHGVHNGDDVMSISARWVGVQEIDVVDDDVVYLRLGKLISFFVPRRAFDSDLAFDEFVTAARQWRSQSPSAEDTCPECRYSLQGLANNGCPECGWRREPEPPPIAAPE